MKGLYVVMFKTYTIMNTTITKDSKETTSLLMKMETNGTLGNTLVFAFKQWYLFPPINTFFVPKYLFS
jgi:hypothetical protein